MKIEELAKDAGSIGICGHIRPDGDCVGSSMALYLYLKKIYPEKTIQVFLEKPSFVFRCIKDFDEIRWDFKTEIEQFDLFIALDTVKERTGEAEALFDNAVKTVNIDHHISNAGTAQLNIIDPEASSTSEMVYEVLEEKNIDCEIAKALYIGIAHDTGVFRYSNTAPKTLQIVSKLIGYGFDFSAMIENTFYEKTYRQNLLLGRALIESIVILNGKCIVSGIEQRTLDFYQADSKDLEGIVSQLNQTADVECAVFFYQTGVLQYKVSLRSKGKVNVSDIAVFFGGGGHVRAAGCTINGNFYDVINNISKLVDKQLKNTGNKEQ